MEYIYLGKNWCNIDHVFDDKIENFDPKSNKNRIKLFNRFPGLNNGRGYTYLDPEDILFIWSDGTLYGENYSSGISSSFNISPEWIVNKRKTRKLVNDAPGNIMSYILNYVDILMRDPSFWILPGSYYTKVDIDKIKELLKKNVESKLTQEQYFVYELQKDEINNMIQDYENQLNKEVDNGY